jgi:tetratricopeptide (TPR) repeat protein
MIKARITLIEEAFDSNDLDSLSSELWPEAIMILRAYRDSRWEDVYILSENAFRSTGCPQERAFFLQWAVGASEVQYDISKRTSLLALWKEIPDAFGHPYCRYLRAFHDGVTRFFDGNLRDSIVFFRQAYANAQAANYFRGQMRALFHLGLVERDQERWDQAAEYFYQALAIANERRATRLTARIDDQLNKITQNSPKCRIEDLILRLQFDEARKLILELEAVRRKSRVGRRNESLGIYLGLIALGRGRRSRCRSLISKIMDPVLKLRVYSIKKRAFGLDGAEEVEMQYLIDVLGVSSISFAPGIDPERVEIAGRPLATLNHPDVKKLLLLLLRCQKPHTKEQIFRGVWEISIYDPTIHDAKVYQLIHKAKAVLKIPNLFMNSYGAYQINPVLLGLDSSHMPPEVERRVS